MIEKRYKLDIDIRQKNHLADQMRFKQNDTNVYPIDIHVNDSGKPIVLPEGTIATFIAKTPISSSEVAGMCKIEDAAKGHLSYTLSTNAIAEPGKVEAEIILISGTKQLTSYRFSFIVEGSISTNEAVLASTEYSVLLEALGQASGGTATIPSIWDGSQKQLDALPSRDDDTYYIVLKE